MTTISERSTIIAVFVDRDQANQAIDNLRRAGFSYEQIRLVERGTSNFIESLKSLFTGQTTTTTNSADDWMRIGVPEQDAHNYQRELDAGHSIVLVKAVDNPEQALGILRQSGAYDIVTRLRTAQPTMAQGSRTPNAQRGPYNPNVPPGTANPNVPPGTYNPNVAPGTNNPNVQPGTYNPNVAPGTNNPNAQPGPYGTQPQQRPANPQGERNA